MKKWLVTFTIAGLTAGWGLFFYKYQENSASLEKQNKVITQKAKNMTITGSTRVSKISEMVSQSIEADTQAVVQVDTQIEDLNGKIEKIKFAIAELNTEKSGLNGRVAKLQRVLGVLSDKTEVLQPAQVDVPSSSKVSTTLPLKEEVKEMTFGEKVVSQFNEKMKEAVAQVAENDKSVVFSFKGETFLIIDDKPARVSAEKSAELIPVVNQIQEVHGVDQVTLKVKDGTSISQVLVLAQYIKRQFGWEAQIQPTVTKETGNSNIAIHFSSTKTAQTATTNDTKKEPSKKQSSLKSNKKSKSARVNQHNTTRL